jgi:hypothetical protein
VRSKLRWSIDSDVKLKNLKNACERISLPPPNDSAIHYSKPKEEHTFAHESLLLADEALELGGGEKLEVLQVDEVYPFMGTQNPPGTENTGRLWPYENPEEEVHPGRSYSQDVLVE